MNYITGTGRLVKEPSSRIASTGTEVSDFRLAMTALGKDTCYIDCSAFGKCASFANKYLKKGDLVAFTGRLAQKEWTAQDGSKRSSYEIVASDLEGISSKKSKGDNTPRVESNRQTAEKSNLDSIEVPEDDMPF
jgi:single-strand DNA-binding protein